MDNRDSNILNEQVRRIHHEYDELKNEFNVLSYDKNKTKPRIRGAISSAGVTAEHLLDYIIRKEGRVTELDALKPNQRGLYEFKKILDDILPEKQKIHIGTIIPWRNLAAHHNKSEYVSDDELRAVETALNSLIIWFFEVYLGGQYADFSKNAYVKKEKSIEDDVRNDLHLKEKLEDNFNNSFNQIQPVDKKKHKRKTSWIVTGIIALILIITFFVYGYYLQESSTYSKHKGGKEGLNKEQVFNLIVKYYDSNNDKKFDAYDFFANRVDQFYLRKDVNPTEIEIIRQTNIDYIDPKNTIDKESLVLFSKNDSVQYWRFNGDYTCYRTSKKKFQNCQIEMEFGINARGKITRIKQINYSNLRYTSNRPQ